MPFGSIKKAKLSKEGMIGYSYDFLFFIFPSCMSFLRVGASGGSVGKKRARIITTTGQCHLKGRIQLR